MNKKTTYRILAGVLLLLCALLCACEDTQDANTPRPYEHLYSNATCTEPQTCTLCGETLGSPLGHDPSEWLEQEVFNSDEYNRERYKICRRCGEKLESEYYQYVPTEEELLAQELEYKEQCKEYSYEALARDPEGTKGTYGKYPGEVVQVLQETNYGTVDYTLRVSITKQTYGYTDTILVSYSAKTSAPRILEDDIVTFWGENAGSYTYETVRGNDLTVPLVHAKYLEIQSLQEQQAEAAEAETTAVETPVESPETTGETETSDGTYRLGETAYSEKKNCNITMTDFGQTGEYIYAEFEIKNLNDSGELVSYLNFESFIDDYAVDAERGNNGDYLHIDVPSGKIGKGKIYMKGNLEAANEVGVCYYDVTFRLK